MAKVNVNELTKEMIEKAMQCENAEELVKLAKGEGYDITKEEAEAFLAENEDVELTDADMKRVAGGFCWGHCGGKGVCDRHGLKQ